MTILPFITFILFIVTQGLLLIKSSVMSIICFGSDVHNVMFCSEIFSTAHTVMAQFCYFWRCMFYVFPHLSQCYWYRLFSLCLFLYSLPAVSFSARFVPGWVQRFVKADLRRATLPPPQAVYAELSPADSIWTAKTLVPFITHPSRNCFCPSQWGFGSIFQLPKTLCWPSRALARWEKM